MKTKITTLFSPLQHYLTLGVARETVKAQMVLTSKASIDFYLLLTISAIIATMGLEANSAATVIGAMIIAPLMNPIVALAYGLVNLDRLILQRALFTLCTGILLTVIVAWGIDAAIGSQIAGAEVLARTNPTLLDMVVALASGAVGAFAVTRQTVANALPGVAISVALVPPLCVVGIGLNLDQEITAELGNFMAEMQVWKGALLLLLTNLAAILYSAGIVYLVQSYTSLRRALIGLLAATLMLYGLSSPLTFSLQKLLLENRTNHAVQVVLAQYYPQAFSDLVSIRLRVRLAPDDLVQVTFDMFVPEDFSVTSGQAFTDDEPGLDLSLLRDALTQKLQRPVDLTVRRHTYEEIRAEPLVSQLHSQPSTLSR